MEKQWVSTDRLPLTHTSSAIPNSSLDRSECVYEKWICGILWTGQSWSVTYLWPSVRMLACEHFWVCASATFQQQKSEKVWLMRHWIRLFLDTEGCRSVRIPISFNHFQAIGQKKKKKIHSNFPLSPRKCVFVRLVHHNMVYTCKCLLSHYVQVWTNSNFLCSLDLCLRCTRQKKLLFNYYDTCKTHVKYKHSLLFFPCLSRMGCNNTQTFSEYLIHPNTLRLHSESPEFAFSFHPL